MYKYHSEDLPAVLSFSIFTTNTLYDQLFLSIICKATQDTEMKVSGASEEDSEEGYESDGLDSEFFEVILSFFLSISHFLFFFFFLSVPVVAFFHMHHIFQLKDTDSCFRRTRSTASART
jgi:hypothetical protein